MGEPLAPAVGEWFSKCFSNGKKAIINTYYQTETGAIICSPKYNETSKFSPHGTVGKPLNKYIKLSNLDEYSFFISHPICFLTFYNGKKNQIFLQIS